MLAAWVQFFVLLAFMAVLLVAAFLLFPQLRTGAGNQVAEILNNQKWKEEIRTALNQITEGAATAAQQRVAPDASTRKRRSRRRG